MSGRASQRHWRSRPGGDLYAKEAARRGLGSRAWFKLEALDARFKLLAPSTKVLELGAAPGGWTRYLASKGARVYACDQRQMEVPAKAKFFCGDVQGEAFRDWSEVNGPYNLVISDMAPDFSGIRTSDAARAERLVALACEIAEQRIAIGGTLVVKLFQGDPLDYFRGWAKPLFSGVRLCKPPASRQESAETYGIAQEFKGISHKADDS